MPLDEHPWIERYGRTRSYADFREGVRAYYRRHYPLTAAARADRSLNPGAGWVSGLCFEPRVGLAVLAEMLAPHLSAGRIVILPRHRPVAVEMDGDLARAVTVLDEMNDTRRTLTAPYILDATELGDLLELGEIERSSGRNRRRETGEPIALEGPAEPHDQMGFTHSSRSITCPARNTSSTSRATTTFGSRRKVIAATRRSWLSRTFSARKHDHFGRAPTPGAYVASTWNFRRMLCRENFVPGAFPSDVTVAIWHDNEYHHGVLCGVSPEERRKHLEAARQLTLSTHLLAPDRGTESRDRRPGFPGLRPRGDFFGTDDGLAQYAVHSRIARASRRSSPSSSSTSAPICRRRRPGR